MSVLLGPGGLPLAKVRANEVHDIGPGHAAMVEIAETTTVDWPNGMAIRMAPGRYAIILAAEIEGMIATAQQSGRLSAAAGAAARH